MTRLSVDETISGNVDSTLRAIEHNYHEFGDFGFAADPSASFGASVETPNPVSSSATSVGSSSITSGSGSGSGCGSSSSLSLFLFLYSLLESELSSASSATI